MRRFLRLVPLFALLFGCVHPAASTEEMIGSTVQITAHIVGTTLDGTKLEAGWSGSGVVYRRIPSITHQGGELILTANHVLDAPAVGTMVLSEMGPVQIVSVEFQVMGEDNQVCPLVPLVLGQTTDEDVATGYTSCDVGQPASIDTREPARGDKVYVVGHPLGFPMPVVTEGYVDGFYVGYLAISAPSAPGNSGGPVFHDGKVVGLLVRGHTGYSHICLMTPLQPILDRIEQTDDYLKQHKLPIAHPLS